MNSTMKPTLDVPGAADLMNVHPKTVLDFISSGVLPAAKVGRAYVLLTQDVLAFVEEQVIAQTAERMKIPGRRVRATKAKPPTRSRAGSRNASSSGATYAR